ncbi:hypothetical protein LOK46_06770 [Methylobacterium sp. NMS14P]|uniref:hypothetical protein n=1 Tax=Methylobacterium sp. NMS14P TaxID=2894310 RepID=UPI002359EE48|nr:hypothetical protein [Methylobacterium sp. NMS14P]WCS26533.1 hypothetical protein LOK46_06770 [Methylobacterium sp. NMS14P]
MNVSLVEAKRTGRSQPTEIVVLPNGPKGPNALQRWLNDRGVGPIERITVKAPGVAWVRPSFGRVGRLVGERIHAWAAMFAAANACESEVSRLAPKA